MINACDSTTESPPEDDALLFPVSPGSWWAYTAWEIYPNGDWISGSETRDSLCIISDYTYNDTAGAVFGHFVDGAIADSMIFAQMGDYILELHDNLFDIDLTQREWMPIIDLATTDTYVIRTFRNRNYAIKFGDSTVHGYMQGVWKGVYEHDQIFEINGRNINTRYYSLTFDTRFDFDLLYKTDSGNVEKVLITRYRKPIIGIWLADGVGIVRYQQNGFTETWRPARPNPAFDGYTIPVNGRLMILENYNIGG